MPAKLCETCNKDLAKCQCTERDKALYAMVEAGEEEDNLMTKLNKLNETLDTAWKNAKPVPEWNGVYGRFLLGDMSPDDRKKFPLGTGVMDYFPDALMAVAFCSWVGNEQHNPGTELHWDRSKSQDESDAMVRHFSERGTMDNDAVPHSAKVAWRALANLQKEIEDARAGRHSYRS